MIYYAFADINENPVGGLFPNEGHLMSVGRDYLTEDEHLSVFDTGVGYRINTYEITFG